MRPFRSSSFIPAAGGLHRYLFLIIIGTAVSTTLTWQYGCHDDGPTSSNYDTGYPGTWVPSYSWALEDDSRINTVKLVLRTDSVFTCTSGFFFGVDSLSSVPVSGRWKHMNVMGRPAGTGTHVIIELSTDQVSAYWRIGETGTQNLSMDWKDEATGELRYRWKKK